MIHHSVSGHFAYRQGPWKLALARASGGWTSPTEKQADSDAPKAQLYHMIDDLGETSNQYLAQPDIAERLLKQLKEDVRRGRSTDGPASMNDVSKINLWKSEKK